MQLRGHVRRAFFLLACLLFCAPLGAAGDSPSRSRVLVWGYSSTMGVQVPDATALADVVAVAAGGTRTLALLASGGVLSWGPGNSDNLVYHPDTNNTPNITSIVAGPTHTLALAQGGGVLAWGDNTNGECSVPAAAGTAVQSVAAGA